MLITHIRKCQRHVLGKAEYYWNTWQSCLSKHIKVSGNVLVNVLILYTYSTVDLLGS